MAPRPDHARRPDRRRTELRSRSARTVAVPLALGAWVNANAFGVLAFRPSSKTTPVYKAGVAGSFISASWGFVGLAAVAWKRWLEHR